MNHPPQQPGPQHGWGRQPGGQYPQSGQQPAWGQQPGGQYPAGGPQQPWDQQQAWGQQPGQPWPQQAYPGQQYPYGQPGPPPPTGKKSKLPWILGGTGGGILLIGLVVVLVLVFTGGGPRAAAEKFAQAVEDQDISTIRGMLCSEYMDAYSPALQGYDPQAAAPLDITTEINEVRSISDTEVSVDASITFGNVPDELKRILPSDTRTQEYTFTKKDGEWKFCATP